MKHEKIITWLLDYATTTKQKGFVVGISGGVDSALVSTLCAMTNLPTLCLTLPILQAESHVNRAKNHVKWLENKFKNVEWEDIDLSNPFKILSSTIFNKKEFLNYELANANLRSRIRMLTLYAKANEREFLVAGTGNKVEDYGIGFFTKYGDGGVDISPIGSLLKTEVWELSKQLGINEEIISAKPTDGLWEDNRSDEESIGATYQELEKAMLFCDKNNIEDFDSLSSYTDIPTRDYEVLEIYLKRHISNKHKMEMPSICIL